MICFSEKTFQEIEERLNGSKKIALLSCGGCPAAQKKGGTVGLNKWAAHLTKAFDIRWQFVSPIMCDERLLKIHIQEMTERLEEIDAIVIFACESGLKLAEEVTGFLCIPCLDSLHYGILREDGHVEKITEHERHL